MNPQNQTGRFQNLALARAFPDNHSIYSHTFLKEFIMRIRITARHQKLSPQIKEYVEDKIQRMERFYDRIVDCDVIMDTEKNKETVEMNARVYGQLLNVKSKDADPTKAVDICLDKLEVQLKKFKSKMKNRPHERMSVALAKAQEIFAEGD